MVNFLCTQDYFKSPVISTSGSVSEAGMVDIYSNDGQYLCPVVFFMRLNNGRSELCGFFKKITLGRLQKRDSLMMEMNKPNLDSLKETLRNHEGFVIVTKNNKLMPEIEYRVFNIQLGTIKIGEVAYREVFEARVIDLAVVVGKKGIFTMATLEHQEEMFVSAVGLDKKDNFVLYKKESVGLNSLFKEEPT